jgi:hypothetical protein
VEDVEVGCIVRGDVVMLEVSSGPAEVSPGRWRSIGVLPLAAVAVCINLSFPS